MKLARITSILLLMLCFSGAALAQGKYNHLKKWANETPIDYTTKPKINFFTLPEIHQPLLKLLGTQNLRRLMKDFGMVVPINLIDGYLVLEGVTSNRTLEDKEENVIVAVNINDKAGTIMVVFSGIGERFGEVEYFCTNGKACNGLPNEVRSKVEEWQAIRRKVSGSNQPAPNKSLHLTTRQRASQESLFHHLGCCSLGGR
jgi:hypothetical protein